MTTAVVIAHHEQSVVALLAVRHEVSDRAAIEILLVLQEFAECFLRYAELLCGISDIGTVRGIHKRIKIFRFRLCFVQFLCQAVRAFSLVHHGFDDFFKQAGVISHLLHQWIGYVRAVSADCRKNFRCYPFFECSCRRYLAC